MGKDVALLFIWVFPKLLLIYWTLFTIVSGLYREWPQKEAIPHEWQWRGGKYLAESIRHCLSFDGSRDPQCHVIPSAPVAASCNTSPVSLEIVSVYSMCGVWFPWLTGETAPAGYQMLLNSWSWVAVTSSSLCCCYSFGGCVFHERLSNTLTESRVPAVQPLV